LSCLFLCQRTPTSTLFPYTTLFRSGQPLLEQTGAARVVGQPAAQGGDFLFEERHLGRCVAVVPLVLAPWTIVVAVVDRHRHHLRSEEHTSELQSRENLVCRLLLEKK